jgi:hypothetical protein
MVLISSSMFHQFVEEMGTLIGILYSRSSSSMEMASICERGVSIRRDHAEYQLLPC